MVWSIIYFTCLRFVFAYFWNFDIFYVEYWGVISEFWQRGGVIKTGKDMSLIFAIFMVIPLWLLTLVIFVKFNYTKIIIFPVKLYDRYMLLKYDPNEERIVIKNLSTKKEKMTIDDMINAKMKQMKKEKDADKNLEADKIRSTIQEKIKNKK